MTGVDPAAAMLDIAGKRPGGDKVRWIEADARSFFLDEHFDMVVMTGHAFQTLLSRDDRVAVLSTIAGHLEEGGRFFFDSRNPDFREWEQWTPEATHAKRPHAEYGIMTRWTDAVWDPEAGIVTYGTFYQFEDARTLSAYSQIAFAPQAEIAELITSAGLTVDRWIGDCKGRHFTSGSPEIIPLGSLPNRPVAEES